MQNIRYLPEQMITPEEFSEFEARIKKVVDLDISLADVTRNIPYRQLVYLFNEGVLLGNPETDKLKNLDFIAYCWIQFIVILRKYGISIDSLREIKRSLIEPIDWLFLSERKEDFKRILEALPAEYQKDLKDFVRDLQASNGQIANIMTLFFLTIVDCVVRRERTSILIDPDFNIVILKEEHLDDYYKIEGFNEIYSGTHLKVSINDIIWAYFGDEFEKNPEKKLALLNDSEMQIIDALKWPNASEVTIKFGKDKKPETLKIVESKSLEYTSRIYELIKSGGYQEITIKTQEGKICDCKNAYKIKLQNGTV